MKTNVFTPPPKSKIINDSPAMIFIADMNTRNIRWCNKTMVKLLGYSLEEMQQMGDALFKTLMHPDDYSNALQAREFFLKDRTAYSATSRFREKNDSKYKWFYGTTVVHGYDNDKHLQTLLCTFLALDETDTPEQTKAALNSLLRHSLMNGPLESLSHSEQELLPFIAQGLNNREIADKLYKSFYTIETHVKHIKLKLNLHSRAGLIALLKRTGY